MKKKREDFEKKVIETIILDNVKIMKKDVETPPELSDEDSSHNNNKKHKKNKSEQFYEKYFPKKTKKIPIFKAQNIQNTHPGKFVNKFATNIKQEELEEKEDKGDFFENLKDFVDGIELNVDGNKDKVVKDDGNVNVFITKSPSDKVNGNESPNNSAKPIEASPKLHQKNIRSSFQNDGTYQKHMSAFVQNLYSKYIKKERKFASSERSPRNGDIPYDLIHRTKLQNMKMKHHKIFKKSHLYNKDNKVTRFAKSLNNELGRISNHFGKIESVNFLGDNPKTQFFFENTNEYLAYKLLKMKEDEKKQRLLPLIVSKDPSMDKLSDGFYKLHHNIKNAFGKKTRTRPRARTNQCNILILLATFRDDKHNIT